MIITVGDIIADLSLRVPRLPVGAGELHPLTHLDIGPGGAANIAIMAARFGHRVVTLGEVGDDRFGRMLRDGLGREGIDTDHLLTLPDSETPVAGVLVDDAGEPAYLGFPGHLALDELPEAWRDLLGAAGAVYADGWVENAFWAGLIIESFAIARGAGIPTFFDPGPGNPAVDSAWHRAAVARATVLLLNEAEAARLTGETAPAAAVAALLAMGPELVVLKRGGEGLLAATAAETAVAPGLDVPLVDTTGAGDSVSGAVLHAWLDGRPLSHLARLANATGAAKIQKRGTGHNLPTAAEVQALYSHFYPEADDDE